MSTVEPTQFFIDQGSRAEHRRLALVALSDLIRDSTTSSDLAFSASELLGLTLNISRVGYGTIDHDAETLIVEREWNAPGVPSLAGILPLRQFGTYIENMIRGELVVIPDVYLDERTVASAAQLESLSGRAFVAVCVTEQARISVILYVNDAKVRAWPADDLAFIKEVANRTRTGIERLRAEAGRNESDERLRELSDDVEREVTQRTVSRGRTWTVSPDLMGVINDKGYFEQSNPAWRSVLGWSEAEVAQTPFLDFIHPDDLAETQAAWIEALERSVPALRFENRYRCRNGSWRWLSWVAVPENGKVYCSARDITADKQQAAELADRTAERDRMWETSPDLMLVIDFEGTFRRVNPAWTRTLGYLAEELVGHHVNEFVLPEDHDQTTDAYELASEGGQPSVVNRYRHKDGTIRWISWVAAPAAGMTYATGRDVTEEKQRSSDLRRYRDIIDATISPICAFDNSYRLVAFNHAHNNEFRRVNGFDTKLGDVFPDLFIPQQAIAMRSFMGRALAGETFKVDAAFGRPELGTPTWEITYTPLRDDEGSVIGAFHLATDITDRLLAEAELSKVHDALRQAQKMEAVGQLTGGLAHDFNNLIAGISGSLEMMAIRLAQGRISDLDRYITGANGAARRAAGLTQRLLAFSRRQTLDPKVTNVNTLVHGMLELIQRSVGPEILLETVISEELWSTFVDVGQLENSLLNLCINARDAMPNGGKITIATDNRYVDERAAKERGLEPGQYLSLSVSDTGTGMKAETIARAFDPFYTTKPIGQGTGLGLSMVHGFAGQSGGAVQIISEIDHGTTIDIYLPRHLGDAVEEDIPGVGRADGTNRQGADYPFG